MCSSDLLYMKKNQEFLRQLIDEAAYVDSGEQLMNYSGARQRKELMEYVVRTMEKEELCEYFSKINGFESREAAKSFVEIVLKNSALLKDESVYTNTHEKLVDPGLKARYTKARKKLLKDLDSH